ncbi:MAG: hypothetical protein WBD36_05310 [Bacteroidota bacterium]
MKPPVDLPDDGRIHNAAKEEMFKALRKKDVNAAIIFNQEFLNLRVFREASDYKDIDIPLPKAKKAYEIAVSICEGITQHFPL